MSSIRRIISDVLASLLSFVPADISKLSKRRRSRKPEEDATFHYNSYDYKVRAKREDVVIEVPVCSKAFVSVHGITKKRRELIQRYLKEGVSPKDRRGSHKNRKNLLSKDALKAVCDRTSSYKGRQSHYSLHDSKRIYLPEDLNVTKMHNHFRERYPNLNVSYQKFKEKFNIKFGYPRTDTCSVCDFVTEVESLKTKLLNVPVSDNEHKLIEKKIQDLTTAN
ncbi:hypothetical protein ANN_20065 [Periplaneta americana]|uniref:Uncharacterized protein n=1 Tax=Periplaneta americana TaxID=6978 RepID=A0ABQ8SCQ8_PERAM|nr:hypothetical protein ANN_20065 [Periplaneta americana]